LPPNAFDGHGNYTFGVNEQVIFPEVDYDRVDSVRGMDITIVTTATTDEQGRALLDAFGFPFKRGDQPGELIPGRSRRVTGRGRGGRGRAGSGRKK
jgi:large subunit ribosomal protein L5